MTQIGMRIIYNPYTGTVLNNALSEMNGNIQDDLRPDRIEFIDLPYGYDENHFRNATKIKVDVNTREVIVLEYWDPQAQQLVTVT